MSGSTTITYRYRRYWLAAAVATVPLLSLLAACGGGSESTGTTGAATSEPSSTTAAPTTVPGASATTVAVSPTSAPPGERLTSASRLRLDGIGPIAVGMTLAEASAAARTTVRITEPNEVTECSYARADGGPAGLAFMVIGGRIVRIDVSAHPSPSPIATLSGIRIGSTEGEVTAAYRGRIEVAGHPYVQTGHYLVYKSDDPALGLIFETDGQRVTSFRSGRADAVQAIEGCS